MRIPAVVVEAVQSKKFLAFITAMIVLWGNRLVARLAPGFEMDPTEVSLAVGTLATYIIGQGIADHGKSAAQTNAAITAAVAMPDGPDKDAALALFHGALLPIAPSNSNVASVKVSA